MTPLPSLTAAEIEAATNDAQAVAARSDGSPNDCPYRLLGASELDKARLLALARLWLAVFFDARAWMREHQ